MRYLQMIKSKQKAHRYFAFALIFLLVNERQICLGFAKANNRHGTLKAYSLKAYSLKA